MNTKWIQVIVFLIPIVLLTMVVWQRLDMDGTTRVHWEPGRVSAFVHGLRPTGRVTLLKDAGDTLARLTGDPLYLSVTPPGAYDSVDVEVTLRSHEQPQVELGATVNAQAGQIDLQPLLQTFLDTSTWSVQRDGDRLFAQRREAYDSFASFLNNPPPLSTIATYHYQLPDQTGVPPSWLRGTPVQQNTVSLRGYEEFITATDGRALTLDVRYMDMNRSPGADPVEIKVFQDGELVAHAEQDDDGVSVDTQASLGMQTLHLSAVGLQSGVVKVELHGSNDIYWREVHTSLPRLTYLSNVTVGDEVGYLAEPRSVELWTDARHLTLLTRHAEGVQTVTVGSQEVEIAVPHQPYQVNITDPGLTHVVIPRGDLVVVTDGRVAFSQAAFFNPFPVRLDDRTDLDAQGVDYLVAQYPAPEVLEDGWVKTRATFALGPLEREVSNEVPQRGGSYRFVVSMPHVEERGAWVEVRSIDLVFHRKARHLTDLVRGLVRHLHAAL